MMEGTDSHTGGVMNMIKGNPPILWEPPPSPESRILLDTGKWIECATPLGNGKDLAYFANVYGTSGAAQCPKLYREKRRIYRCSNIKNEHI